MKPKSLALLLLALGCGLVASIGITRVMNNKPATAVPGAEPVVVAAADVGMGEMLTADRLKVEHWPKGKNPAGIVADIQNVEGRRTRARLYAGEPILEDKLFAKGVSQQGAAALIQAGFRVVTVKVDSVSGGGSLILPGDHVDLMVHLVRDSNRGILETVTRTILQNLKVFAVNDVLDVEKDGNKSIAAKTISLLVTPEQAAKVNLAAQMGTINLVMRSPEDVQRVDDVQAKPSELFGTAVQSEKPVDPPPKAIPQPPAVVSEKPVDVPKPRSTWTLRVVKPNEINDVTFEKDGENDQQASGSWKTVTTETVSAVKDAGDNNDAKDAKNEKDKKRGRDGKVDGSSKPREPQITPEGTDLGI